VVHGGSWWFMVVHGGVSEHPARECPIHVELKTCHGGGIF
jgi:hypothetical protein